MSNINPEEAPQVCTACGQLHESVQHPLYNGMCVTCRVKVGNNVQANVVILARLAEVHG